MNSMNTMPLLIVLGGTIGLVLAAIPVCMQAAGEVVQVEGQPVWLVRRRRRLQFHYWAAL